MDEGAVAFRRMDCVRREFDVSRLRAETHLARLSSLHESHPTLSRAFRERGQRERLSAKISDFGRSIERALALAAGGCVVRVGCKGVNVHGQNGRWVVQR